MPLHTGRRPSVALSLSACYCWLVVLTRPMSSADQNAPKTPQSQGDVDGFAWADDGQGYSLVGHATPESLRPIANEVRKQARAI